MNSVNILEVLQKKPENGMPHYHLCEIFKRHGELVDALQFGWIFGDTLYDANPNEVEQIKGLIAKGQLTYTTDEYVKSPDANVHRLELAAS